MKFKILILILCFIKKLYFCKIKNLNMNNQENKQQNVFMKILEDQKAIRECIRNKGDLKKLADERHIKFATPI